MGKKVAKLVTVSFITRVIVDENATEDEILETARPHYIEKTKNELNENIESIIDDTECPYNPETDK